MKQLLIPIVIGVLAGLGGGSGYAYMQASAKYAADSARIADSLKTLPADSLAKAADAEAAHNDTTHAESALDDSTAVDSTHAALPLTPADSLRALAEARTALKKAGAKPEAAAKPTPNTVAQGMAAAKAAGGHTSPTQTPTSTPPAPTAAPSASTTQAAAMVKEARDAALQTVLPEQRLAKIFGAMNAKDAAKVLDQMTDGDVRAILAMMNDRQAAAILASFPAARAAAITKGAVKSPGAATP